jgi:hypothetical protein
LTAAGVRAAAATRRLTARPALVLATGTAALLVLRLVFSLARSGPVIMADEAGYLMNARVLAGGMPAEMGSSPFYRGGYSLVIAPLFQGDDPVAIYHAVLALNAALAACLAPLLYLLVTRCLGAPRPLAAWSALAGAAYPSVTTLSQVALSENLLFPATAAWLLAAGSLAAATAHRDTQGPGRPRIGRREGRSTYGIAVPAVATGVLAGALWTVHARMLVAVVLTVALLAALVVRRRVPPAVAVAGVLALAGVMVAGHFLNHWLIVHSYAGRSSDELHRALSSLNGLRGVPSLLRNLVGQGWYVLVATLGIALIVVTGAVPRSVRRVRESRDGPGDRVVLLVVATAAGLLLVSALWLVHPDRADQLIYGRYVEPVVPALVAVGLVTLPTLARPPARALLAAVACVTVAVVALRSGLHPSVDPSRWNVAALPSVTGQLGAPVLLVAGAVAAVAGWLLLAVLRRAPALVAPLALALFVPTTAYSEALPVLRSQHDVYPAGWSSPRAVVASRHATAVAYDLGHFDHVAVKVYQWFMPRTRFVLFDGRREAPPTAVFFSARTLSGKPARGRHERIWVDPGRDQALWGPPGH